MDGMLGPPAHSMGSLEVLSPSRLGQGRGDSPRSEMKPYHVCLIMLYIWTISVQCRVFGLGLILFSRCFCFDDRIF